MPLYPAAPSPKRKRDERPHSPQSRVIARRLGTSSEKLIPPSEGDIDSETQSPRSRVARKLGDLEIEGAGGVSKLDLFGSSQLDGDETRNSTTSAQSETKEVPETPQASYASSGPTDGTYPDENTPLGNDHSHVIFADANSTSISTATNTALPRRSNHKRPTSPPSVSRRRRSPTPDPPSRRLSPVPSRPFNPESSLSQEPVSLHWQESEITGHNPSDPEDDGEGINGIGFKPTAAIARARSERRRKQLAEYKTREDKEARDARAKRIALRRRTVSEGASSQSQVAEKERRVRFSEAERAIDVL